MTRRLWFVFILPVAGNQLSWATTQTCGRSTQVPLYKTSPSSLSQFIKRLPVHCPRTFRAAVANFVSSNWTKINNDISIFNGSIPKIFIKYNPQKLDKYSRHAQCNVTSTRGNRIGLISNTYILSRITALNTLLYGCVSLWWANGMNHKSTEQNWGCLTNQLHL